MKKIYISCDIEGIAGVVHGDHCGTNGGNEYQRARHFMTQEVNAAAKGFYEAGVELVVVNDSHGGMRNIFIEELLPDIELITGSPKPMSMMEGCSEEFDGVAFIGYHARMGSHGVLSHTISGGAVSEIRVNGRILGEGGINAAIAAEFGLPVIMMAGDAAACREAEQDYAPPVAVATKIAVTRYSARSLTPQKAQNAIYEGAKRAIAEASNAKPFLVDRPCRIELRFLNSGHLDAACRLPGSIQVDPVTLAYEAPNFLEGYKGLRCMIALAQ